MADIFECYIHFTFEDGSNPYIATKYKKAFELLTSYEYEQIGNRSFRLYNRTFSPTGYYEKKFALRTIAINWQSDFTNFRYSWGDLFEWGEFFSELGRKYGLLREFHENCIC